MSHWENKKMRNKKAQQEILGFVLIVILVSIMFLIFLSFSIGNGSKVVKNSAEISNFLEAAMDYTTNCSTSYDSPLMELRDVVKSCFNNNGNCIDGKSSCDAANSTLNEIIVNGLGINENSPNKGYKLDVYYNIVNSTAKQDEKFNLTYGNFKNCTSVPGAIHSIPFDTLSSGNINVELEVCKG